MTQVLNLDSARVFNKKISINVLNKDAENTIFTLSLEGLEFNREQLNEFMGPYTFESWYNQGSDNVWRPMDWWARQKSPDYRIADEFDCEGAVIVVDNERLEFETIEADEEDSDGENIPAAHISAIVLTPTTGGVTKVAFHMQVRPGLGETNTTLQEYQYRWISVTLSETKLSERKGTQQNLPLQQPQDVQKPAQQPQTDCEPGQGSAVVLDGSHIAATQSERPIAGGFEPSKTAEQIDAEMRASHPGGEQSVVYASTAEGEEIRRADELANPESLAVGEAALAGTMPDVTLPPIDDSAEFEAGVAKALGTHVNSNGAIDGLSERAREASRRRLKGEAA